MARLSQHKSSADWFDGTSRIDVEWYPTRQEALAAEMQAIKSEHPIYNKMGRVAESVGLQVERKGITAGSLNELGWYCKLWCRLVGRWEDKARNDPSIVMSLRYWKLAHQNAEKVDILWFRRKKRLNPSWNLWCAKYLEPLSIVR